jgi:hypothetical protein
MSILITLRKQLIPNRVNELLLGAINTREFDILILYYYFTYFLIRLC